MPQTPLNLIAQKLVGGALTLLKTDSNGYLYTAQPSGQSSVVKQSGLKYYTVAASQTNSALGTGAIGDAFSGLLIVPATTSPGAVSVKDGGGSAITVFTGGATSVADLKPFFLPFNMLSAVGGWSITTGANVSVIAVGTFTP